MSKLLSTTPRQDGFRMPAEWERHHGCWMLWPERPSTFRLGAKPAQMVFAQIATMISSFERVTMGVSVQQYENARRLLPANIRVVEMSYNDSWMRDCGPIFVNNGESVRAVKWGFNAWGGLNGGIYFPWDKDQLVAEKVAELEWFDRYAGPMILEGGSIAVDGEGTLITTEECLLNPNRNPTLSKSEIEANLMEFLNVDKVVWLPRGCVFDETSGHVDEICTFIRPSVVILSWTDDQNDPQYEVSNEAYEILKHTTDARGRKLEVHKIHQPRPVYITKEESAQIDLIGDAINRDEGTRTVASYVNFYFANNSAIVPQFGDDKDLYALQHIQDLLPERKIVGIPRCREIAIGGGNIHCITQQQPIAASK